MGVPFHKGTNCFLGSYGEAVFRDARRDREKELYGQRGRGGRPSSSFTSLLGTGSQQVDYIQMVADVGQDLELSHQSFVLAGCGPLCVRHKEESGRQDNGALSAGGGIPALRVCQCSAGCFVNFPTFCRKTGSPDCFHYSLPPEPTSF